MKCLWILIYAPHLNNEKLEGKNIYVWPESKDYNKCPNISVMDFKVVQREMIVEEELLDKFEDRGIVRPLRPLVGKTPTEWLLGLQFQNLPYPGTTNPRGEMLQGFRRIHKGGKATFQTFDAIEKYAQTKFLQIVMQSLSSQQRMFRPPLRRRMLGMWGMSL